MAKAKVKVTRELLDRAISSREPRAVRQLVAILTPIFVVRIGRVLLSNGDGSCRDIDDLCQDTFVALFQNDGRLVRLWDPARGLSFENYSGLVAKQCAIERLRKRTELLFDDDGLWEELEPDSSRMLECLVADREMFEKVLDRLKVELSDLGRTLLELLFVQWLEVPEVCTRLKMEAPTVYQWRSRLLRHIEEIASELRGPT